MCLILGVQLVRGFILSCHYTATTDLAYDSVVHIIQNVNLGWAIRRVHSNGASIFFVIIYAHIGRGVYYHSFYMKKVWTVGVALYLLLMCVAFLGYVLPWGQISYWGATVITRLFRAVPLVGSVITK